MGMFAALIVAAVVGASVYRSCTRYKHMLKASLAIDAVGAIVLVATYHFVGVW